MSSRKEFEELSKTPEWAAYVVQMLRLETLLGKALREKPYDFNGVLIREGDHVRSTLGLDGRNIREGIAQLSEEPDLPNCITVDGWTSAASLWEVVDKPST